MVKPDPAHSRVRVADVRVNEISEPFTPRRHTYVTTGPSHDNYAPGVSIPMATSMHTCAPEVLSSMRDPPCEWKMMSPVSDELHEGVGWHRCPCLTGSR